MPRIARGVLPGVPHHITQRGNNCQIIFEDESDHQYFCHLLNDHADKNGTNILAYCLMPNHVHAIGVPEHENSLFKTFHAVSMRYAQYFHKKKETSGHLWQGRYYSIPMNEKHLYRAIRYVEQNPVRSGIVKKAWQYRWSSTQFHVGMVKEPDILLKNTNLEDKNSWKDYLCEENEDFKSNGRVLLYPSLKHTSLFYSNRMLSR